MELGATDRARQGRLMAAPSMVFTARFAASRFRVEIEVIEELTEQMEPDDGRFSVIVTGAASDEGILNILSRRREPPQPLSIVTSENLELMHPPVANCSWYYSLRGIRAAA